MHEATLISSGDKPVLRFERFLPRRVEGLGLPVTAVQPRVRGQDEGITDSAVFRGGMIMGG